MLIRSLFPKRSTQLRLQFVRIATVWYYSIGIKNKSWCAGPQTPSESKHTKKILKNRNKNLRKVKSVRHPLSGQLKAAWQGWKMAPTCVHCQVRSLYVTGVCAKPDQQTWSWHIQPWTWSYRQQTLSQCNDADRVRDRPGLASNSLFLY